MATHKFTDLFLPCAPCAKVVLALHGVDTEGKEHSRGDDKCFQDEVNIIEGDDSTQRDALE